MTALIFCLALLFVFAVAFTAALILVARNARDAEREGMEIEIDDLSSEVEQCRHARVAEARYSHECEVALASAGLRPPSRPT